LTIQLRKLISAFEPALKQTGLSLLPGFIFLLGSGTRDNNISGGVMVLSEVRWSAAIWRVKVPLESLSVFCAKIRGTEARMKKRYKKDFIKGIFIFNKDARSFGPSHPR
jgi:hypothetical protein